MRAKTPYKGDTSAPQTFDYEHQEIWLSLWTFGHPELNALKLKLHRDEEDGSYHDEDDRIIIADGCIKLAGISPYDDFIDWCKTNNIGLFIFGWDWRRPLDDTARFFVEKFLPQFRKSVMKRCNDVDPLKNFTLIGHSFGGMIVNLILREKHPLADQMNKAITVATPFYGYSGQVHRWFEGIELLNHLGENKKDLIKTLSSLPASYTLNWLDEKTFSDNTEAFGSDPDFPLLEYPSKAQADPYNPPQPDELGRVRYPLSLGFDPEELARGRDLCRKLVASLPDELQVKFFNIRGVQTSFDRKTVIKETICSTTWQLIDPNFDPTLEQSPVTDGAPEAGDQVLPAWSTHLLTLPKQNRITVQGILHHSFILSSTEVQNVLGTLLGVAAPREQPSSVPDVEIANTDEVEKWRGEAKTFVQDLHDFLRDPKRGFLHVDKTLEKVLGFVAAGKELLSDEARRSVIRRIIMDLIK